MSSKNNDRENKERYMKLFLIFVALLIIDIIIPDPIPVIDELVLGGGTLINAIKTGKAVKVYKSVVRVEQVAKCVNSNNHQNKSTSRENINDKEFRKLDNF